MRLCRESPGKQISEYRDTLVHSLLPSTVHLSEFFQRAALRLVASKRCIIKNRLQSDNDPNQEHTGSLPHKDPLFTNVNRRVFINVIPVKRAKFLLIIETQYNRGHAACSRCVLNQSRAEEGGERFDCTGAGGLCLKGGGSLSQTPNSVGFF